MSSFKNVISTILDKKVLGNVTIMQAGILTFMFVGFVAVVNVLSYAAACTIAG
jgi:hypothetical protein